MVTSVLSPIRSHRGPALISRDGVGAAETEMRRVSTIARHFAQPAAPDKMGKPLRVRFGKRCSAQLARNRVDIGPHFSFQTGPSRSNPSGTETRPFTDGPASAIFSK